MKKRFCIHCKSTKNINIKISKEINQSDTIYCNTCSKYSNIYRVIVLPNLNDEQSGVISFYFNYDSYDGWFDAIAFIKNYNEFDVLEFTINSIPKKFRNPELELLFKI